MSTTLIQGGRVYTNGSLNRADVAIQDGTVSAIGTDLTLSPDNVIEARGLVVAPGFIDLHCHIFTHPDSLASRLNADRIGVS